MALVGCREKNIDSSDSNRISYNSRINEKVVDENEFTIPFSDRTKSSFVTPSECLPGDIFWTYVRYHGMSEDGKKFILSVDSNTPLILFIGLKGGVKALNEIKPPLKPYNDYHFYPIDSILINLLNREYGVVSVDPNKITLREIKK